MVVETQKDDIEARIAELDEHLQKADTIGEQIAPLIKAHFLAYTKEHINPLFSAPYQPTEENVAVSTDYNQFVVAVNLTIAKGAKMPQLVIYLQRKLENYEKVKPEYRARVEVHSDLPGPAFGDHGPLD